MASTRVRVVVAAIVLLLTASGPSLAAPPVVRMPSQALLPVELRSRGIQADTLVLFDTRVSLAVPPRFFSPAERNLFTDPGAPSADSFYRAFQPFGRQGFVRRSWEEGRFKRLVWVLPFPGPTSPQVRIEGFLRSMGDFRPGEVLLETAGDDLKGTIQGVPVTVTNVDRLSANLPGGAPVILDFDLDFLLLHLADVPAEKSTVDATAELCSLIGNLLKDPVAVLVSPGEMKQALPPGTWYLEDLVAERLGEEAPEGSAGYWRDRARAQFLRAIGQPQAARLIYADLARERPTDAGLLFESSVNLLGLNLDEEAVEVMAGARKADPAYALGLPSYLRTMAGKSRETFQRAVQAPLEDGTAAAYPEVAVDAAALLSSIGRPAEARAVLEKLRDMLKGEVGGDRRFLDLAIGDTYYEEGDYSRAREVYERGLGGGDLDHFALRVLLPALDFRMAAVLARSGDAEGSARYLLRHLQANP